MTKTNNYLQKILISFFVFFLSLFFFVFSALTSCNEEPPLENPKDKEKPVISIKDYYDGDTFETSEGEEIQIPRATAVDNVDGKISVDIKHSVDFYEPSKYVIAYEAKDKSGNKAKATLNLLVKAVPKITIVGYEEGGFIPVIVSQPIAIPLATAVDRHGNDVACDGHSLRNRF